MTSLRFELLETIDRNKWKSFIHYKSVMAKASLITPQSLGTDMGGGGIFFPARSPTSPLLPPSPPAAPLT